MNDSPAPPEPCPLYRQATCQRTRAILTARTEARTGGKADASERVPTGATGGITDVSRRIRSSPCADRPVPASRDPIVRIPLHFLQATDRAPAIRRGDSSRHCTRIVDWYEECCPTRLWAAISAGRGFLRERS